MPKPFAKTAIDGNDSKPIKLGDNRYRKELIRVGTFRVPGSDITLDVTPDRLDKWVENFKLMRDDGESIDLTKDHLDGAEGQIGKVHQIGRARIDGDKIVPDEKGDVLFGDIEPADEDCDKIVQRCPKVSVEIEEDFEIGTSKKFDEALTAVSVVRKPVVGGQTGPVKIAASRDSGTGNFGGVVVCFSADSKPKDKTKLSRGDDMLTNEQITEIRKITGIGDDVDGEEFGKKLIASLNDKPENQTEAVTKLTRERDQLKTQVATLEKGKVPDVDPDLLEVQAKNTKLELDRLEKDQFISKKQREAFEEIIAGKEDGRPKVMLSRKVAEASGFKGALGEILIGALGQGKPFKPVQRSGAQVVTLSREQEDEENKQGADDWTDEAIKEANEGITTGV